MSKTEDELQFELGVYCDNGDETRLESLLESYPNLIILPEGDDHEVSEYILTPALAKHWEVVKILLQHYITNNLLVHKVGSDEYLHAQAMLSEVVNTLEEWEVSLAKEITILIEPYLIDISDDSSVAGFEDLPLPVISSREDSASDDAVDIIGSDDFS